MPDDSPFSLDDKVVVQFGGTGLLGPALMTALGRAGATVIVASRNPGALSPLIESERESIRSLYAEQVDIESEPSLLALRDRVLTQYKRIDGMVFNVTSRPMSSFGDDLTKWQSSMATNATGFFATVRIFGDAMAQQRQGSIVNIASMHGMIGLNPWLYEGTSLGAMPDYFFHKGGMINLSRYLASYYGAQRVRVNTVSPGGIRNPERPHAPELLERYAKLTALGRMAEAREIGGAVVFLLSDAASYITGANLCVDGGYTAK